MTYVHFCLQTCHQKELKPVVYPPNEKKLFSLSKLSDEEIRQMMASIASDESEEDNDSSGDFDDDDSIADPDFQVSSEKDAEIEECMSELGRPSPTEPLFHPCHQTH